MQKYELVILLDPKTQEKERKVFLSEFESKLKDSILEKDDMGVRDLSYGLSRIGDRDTAYFMSYYLDLDPTRIQEVKDYFLYNDMVYRYSIFNMKETQPFWSFDKLNKELEKIINGWDKKRFGERVSFFSIVNNAKYINWKAITMLKKYTTRFANIKPRKYTKNKVSTQKTLRKAIIRARELGLLEYKK